MPVLPFVEDIEGEGDTPVDHHPGTGPDPDGRDQANPMGAPLMNMEDSGLVTPQVSPQPRDRSRVPRDPKRELEKGETGFGTGRLEITTSPAPEPHVVSPVAQASGRRQYLYHRPGVQPVFVNQVEDAKPFRHGSSIGASGWPASAHPSIPASGHISLPPAGYWRPSAAVTHRRQRVAGWPASAHPSIPASGHISLPTAG
jgi:hypothetical protein